MTSSSRTLGPEGAFSAGLRPTLALARYARSFSVLLCLLLVVGCSSDDLELGGDGGVPQSDTIATGDGAPSALPYVINDTAQDGCYDETGTMTCPAAGATFFGQDSQYGGTAMSFRDNGDNTVTDLRTGLMWQKARGSMVTWDAAMAGAKTFDLAGHTDWRMPTIKELYSLIDFRGASAPTAEASIPYLDPVFEIAFGDTSAGQRLIDAQDWSATEYVSTTMNGDATVFGVNFIDGRIKGYGKIHPQDGPKKLYVRYVRDSAAYGKNDFADNGDGTISDRATGLMWQKADAGKAMRWKDALAYCEGLSLGNKDDWRLPNAKELQSIVDYSRAPTVTNSAAIDPIFSVTEIESYYWSSTTHLEGAMGKKGQAAVYVCFGRAFGFMEMPPNSGNVQKIDVHGAGAQRSDFKSGDASAYPQGHGPQGDDIRIDNAVRCVRGTSS